jgi:hypothetical protein
LERQSKDSIVQIEETKGAEDSITVCFSQDGARVTIPESEFRTGILGSDGWQAPSRCVQVVEMLQFEVLTVCVGDQNFVNGV